MKHPRSPENICDMCGRAECAMLYEVRSDDGRGFYLVGAECMRRAALDRLEKLGLL